MKFQLNTFLISLLKYKIAAAIKPCPDGEFLSNDGRCHPNIFVPTYEYKNFVDGQTVLGDQKIHVQISMATGEKKAKLLDPFESTASSIVVKDNRQNAITSNGAPHKPIGEMSDNEKFNYYTQQLQNKDGNSQEVGDALIGLEDLTHETDFGEKLFTKSETLNTLVEFLGPKWPSYRRARVAILLGTALQNNPKAQKEAHKFNLTNQLLNSLTGEDDPETISRLIYAISASVRGDSMVLKSFIEARGLNALYQVYQKHFSKGIDNKILTLLSDVNNPNLQPISIQDSSKSAESEKRLDSVQHEPHVLEDVKNWCASIQAEFTKNFKRKPESEASALANLVHVYSIGCDYTTGFINSLESAIDTVGNSEFYEEYVTNLKSLTNWAKKSV